MSEVLFYQLGAQPLEAVLPVLLTKTLQRGWRAVVQTGSLERMEAIDSHLWTFADDAFLAHGTSADGFEAEQPVFLTTDSANPNGATVRFIVDRALPPADASPYERIVLLFDGNDPEALDEARAHWKTLKSAGHTVTYWLQNDRGIWEKKA
jgi:DNA polymerase-3 subunit chi